MKLKTKKFYKFLPKRLQTRRMAYFGVALVMLFSTLSYSLFFRKAPGVKAATVGTSSLSAASTQYSGQRHSVVSSNGTIMMFYAAGAQSPSGLTYSKSTDNGVTWSAGVQVDSSTTTNFSVAIDGNDNVYIVYSISPSTYLRKLTYGSGSWSIGSANTVITGNCSGVGSYTASTVAVDSTSQVWVNTVLNSACGGSYSLASFRSTTLSSWTASTVQSLGTASSWAVPIVAVGKSVWSLAINNGVMVLYADINSSGTWSLAINSGVGVYDPPTMVSGNDQLHIFYDTASVALAYRSYSLSTSTLSAATTISADANDVLGSITTDSHNIWVFYQDYVGANSYNVVYKRFNGTAWDSSATAITTDNLNNVSITSPARQPSTSNLNMFWTTGTASPYTVKSGAISTIGTATDTGNQSGTYTGSLTGSSGDILVKSGTWYYDTVNIVAGMTVKVASSDGVTGGNLTIYANTVTVAGTLDGASRGLPGGVNIYGTSGAGGGGGSGPTFGGSSGSAGTSFGNINGTGSFAASGGAAGTSSAGGAGGGSAGTNGGGGSGGAGSTTTVGSNAAAIAGYLGAATNSDTSTNEFVTFGSGGGAGGTGGSGAGGGGGGGGETSGLWPAPGGTGGSGGRGGYGGKGGNGGAIIKIYARGNLSVSGSIVATGQSGSSGVAGEAGQVGGAGQIGCDPGIC